MAEEGTISPTLPPPEPGEGQQQQQHSDNLAYPMAYPANPPLPQSGCPTPPPLPPALSLESPPPLPLGRPPSPTLGARSPPLPVGLHTPICICPALPPPLQPHSAISPLRADSYDDSGGTIVPTREQVRACNMSQSGGRWGNKEKMGDGGRTSKRVVDNDEEHARSFSDRPKGGGVVKMKMALGKRPGVGSTITMKLKQQVDSSSVKKKPRTEAIIPSKPASKLVAQAFGSDSDEDEEMPPEAKLRMRNVGRDTPTSSGPNSFYKTAKGFTDPRGSWRNDDND